MNALDLLSGDAQAFTEKVWASRTHLHHTDPERLVGLLSFDDVDHLLTSTAIRTPAVRMAQDGQVLASSAFTRTGAVLGGVPLAGLVDGRKVVDLFEGGATLVLQGLQRYWTPLARLVAELELDLGHPCQANAYLTPPGSQGFAVHSDVHDVFVFQTHGSKLWEVHPAPGEDAAAGPREVLLEPGLSMYLPTGTPHAARAQDTVSLHVTIGVNQHTWSTLLDRAVRRARRDVADDGHLPAGHLERPELLRDGLASRLEELAAALRAVDPDDVVAAHQAELVTGRHAPLRGALVDRMALDDLGVDTPLRRRPGKPCVVRRDPADAERLQLYLGDRRVSVPARIEPAVTTLRSLLAEGTFVPAQLGLDDASAVVLTRRLVREGLLEVVRPA